MITCIYKMIIENFTYIFVLNRIIKMFYHALNIGIRIVSSSFIQIGLVGLFVDTFSFCKFGIHIQILNAFWKTVELFHLDCGKTYCSTD
jgi:hypothetical protein